MDIREKIEQIQIKHKKKGSKSGKTTPSINGELVYESVDDEFNAEPTEYMADMAPRETPVESLVTGDFTETEEGPVFTTDYHLAPGELHGSISPLDLGSINSGILSQFARQKDLADIDWSKAISIDTETTGLAGGAGTAAFMVGIGEIIDGAYRVRQYFMRDFSEEEAMLKLLVKDIERASALISYNGKSYDIPLLQSRMIYNRIPVDLEDIPHLDLLHGARRLWRLRGSACKLSSLENQILGVEREDDVPGNLIPDLYFRFVQTKDARLVERIFYHNQVDILSLACLTVSAVNFFGGGAEQDLPFGVDYVSLGRAYEGSKMATESISAYEAALDREMPENVRAKLLYHLSLAYKKEKRWAEACGLWEELLSASGRLYLFASIELSKYYEHKSIDLEKSLNYVDSAIYYIEKLNDYSLSRSNLESLDHRRNRLLKKKDAETPE
jgi:uncharacterized protein